MAPSLLPTSSTSSTGSLSVTDGPLKAAPAPDGWFDARKGPAKYDATAAETAWGPR